MSPPLPTDRLLGLGLLVIALLPILLKRVASFLCLLLGNLQSILPLGKVTFDSMGVAVYDGVSILIISLSATVILGGYFGFRWCRISTLFLMLNFCAIDF